MVNDQDRVLTLLGRYRSGDEDAATELFSLFRVRLLNLANKVLVGRTRRRVGPSDVIQSVLRSFFSGVRAGRYDLDRSEAIWHLLAAITINKARQQMQRHLAARRSIAAEASSLPEDDPTVSLVSRECSPQEAAVLLDEIELLLADCESPAPEILALALQGFTPSQVADRVGSSRWTVRRVLDRFGRQLERKWAAEK